MLWQRFPLHLAPLLLQPAPPLRLLPPSPHSQPTPLHGLPGQPVWLLFVQHQLPLSRLHPPLSDQQLSQPLSQREPLSAL
jgi:hypothetical protein